MPIVLWPTLQALSTLPPAISNSHDPRHYKQAPRAPHVLIVTSQLE